MAGHNCYSGPRATGRMVLVTSHAERIAITFDNEAAAGHPRNIRGGKIIGDPWHFLPVRVKSLAWPRLKLEPAADCGRRQA